MNIRERDPSPVDESIDYINAAPHGGDDKALSTIQVLRRGAKSLERSGVAPLLRRARLLRVGALPEMPIDLRLEFGRLKL
jgi:hypothetical protein